MLCLQSIRSYSLCPIGQPKPTAKIITVCIERKRKIVIIVTGCYRGSCCFESNRLVGPVSPRLGAMIDSWISFVVVDPVAGAAIAWGHRVYKSLREEDRQARDQRENQVLRDRVFAAEFALRHPSKFNGRSESELREIRDRACEQLQNRGHNAERELKLARDSVRDRSAELRLQHRDRFRAGAGRSRDQRDEFRAPDRHGPGIGGL